MQTVPRPQGCLENSDRYTLRYLAADEALNRIGPSILKMPSGYIQVSPWLTISNKQMDLMARYMTELGLTPSARSRFAVQMPSGPKPWDFDPAAEFVD